MHSMPKGDGSVVVVVVVAADGRMANGIAQDALELELKGTAKLPLGTANVMWRGPFDIMNG